MAATIITLSALVSGALAAAEPAVTAAAMLYPRQASVDPALVGYISASSGYDNGRTCDYPQTMSTSGSFAQCCPTSGACPFYTACSSNTLLVASASPVPCDVNPGLQCNTAVLAATAGADGGASYLACWQATLGSSAFTFVQDIGSASVAAPASATETGSAASSSASSQASATASNAVSSTAHSSSASATGSKSSSSASAASSSSAAESASSSSESSNSTSDASPAGTGLGFMSVAIGAVALLAWTLL